MEQYIVFSREIIDLLYKLSEATQIVSNYTRKYPKYQHQSNTISEFAKDFRDLGNQSLLQTTVNVGNNFQQQQNFVSQKPTTTKKAPIITNPADFYKKQNIPQGRYIKQNGYYNLAKQDTWTDFAAKQKDAMNQFGEKINLQDQQLISLIKNASNELDKKEFYKTADILDNITTRSAQVNLSLVPRNLIGTITTIINISQRLLSLLQKYPSPLKNIIEQKISYLINYIKASLSA